jgi:hypothetical protein
MIISLRGTNGAGKSTIVKNIMDRYPQINSIKIPDRRKPLGYICRTEDRCLFVPGHYEINNGGIDTIGDLEKVYKWILSMHEFGADVLYEGMNLSDGIKHIVALHRLGLDVRIVFIDLSLEKCVAAVQARGHNIQQKTIASIYNKCHNQRLALQTHGVAYRLLHRKAALLQIATWLGVQNENHIRQKRVSRAAADDQLPSQRR